MIDWRASLDVVVHWTFHNVVIRRTDDAESYAPLKPNGLPRPASCHCRQTVRGQFSLGIDLEQRDVGLAVRPAIVAL